MVLHDFMFENDKILNKDGRRRGKFGWVGVGVGVGWINWTFYFRKRRINRRRDATFA